MNEEYCVDNAKNKICSLSLSLGFTLIELSIVLVIIGLIVGGVLVGQNLINAATVRSQITQIERFNTAARTFRVKYGYLPGDIPDPQASSFGFAARGAYAGQGDGNGIIVGNHGCSGCDSGEKEAAGETVMFWVDLNKAGLIEGSFTTATSSTEPGSDITGSAVGNYLPSAKIGQGNYIYVWAGGSFSGGWVYTGVNYYGISAVSTILAASLGGKVSSTPGLSVSQAYNIDQKIDDGLPQTGKVVAIYLGTAGSGDPIWTDGTDSLTQIPPQSPSLKTVSPSATTCYDNAGVANAAEIYTTKVNGGNGINCALSFQFQ